MTLLVKDLDRIAVNNGTTIKRMRNAVERALNKATDDHMSEGSSWYATANAEAVRLSEQSGYTVEQVAAAISHLSPRLHWVRNLEAAESLVLTGDARAVMSRGLAKAKEALKSDNPVETFSPGALKTTAFYHNIVGDLDQVTVDVWASRLVNVDEKTLGRVGMYQAVSHSYRLAAKSFDLKPAEAQAIGWTIVRGRSD